MCHVHQVCHAYTIVSVMLVLSATCVPSICLFLCHGYHAFKIYHSLNCTMTFKYYQNTTIQITDDDRVIFSVLYVDKYESREKPVYTGLNESKPCKIPFTVTRTFTGFRALLSLIISSPV